MNMPEQYSIAVVVKGLIKFSLVGPETIQEYTSGEGAAAAIESAAAKQVGTMLLAQPIIQGHSCR